MSAWQQLHDVWSNEANYRDADLVHDERAYITALNEAVESVLTPASGHTFLVTVDRCTNEQAETVMVERLGHDDDYGFDYVVDWESAS